MFFAIRQQRYRSSSAAVGVRFIAPAYTYSPRIRNSFEIHSRNVRNVFVICTLHIRRVKVWFLRHKSMVFGVQKGGFCIARSGFLHCKSMVFVFWMLCCCNPSATIWQFVRHIMAIHSQHYWQAVSSRRGANLSHPCPRIPRNYIAYLCRWHYNLHHFDISKPFGLDWRTGTMNLPLCLTYCSLPYIYAINGYCVLFAAVYFAP